MHLDMATAREQSWFVGDTSSTQEPVFVPKSAQAAEGEGYVLGVVNRRAENRSDLLVFDAGQLDQGPIATVKIPVRLKYGIHGNWVPRNPV
jgi:carotenoid cleavage dioxygenase